MPRNGSAAAGASTAKSISPARSARSAVLGSVITRTLISSKFPRRVPLYAALRRNTTPFCLSKDATWYAPEPTGLKPNSAPRCSTAFLLTMQPEPSAITTSKILARGCASVMRPSYLPLTSTPTRCSQSAL